MHANSAEAAIDEDDKMRTTLPFRLLCCIALVALPGAAAGQEVGEPW